MKIPQTGSTPHYLKNLSHRGLVEKTLSVEKVCISNINILRVGVTEKSTHILMVNQDDLTQLYSVDCRCHVWSKFDILKVFLQVLMKHFKQVLVLSFKGNYGSFSEHK